jgi:periplasmic protein CpxP/Spy
MRKQLRPLALFTCLTAAIAFGSQIAAADTGGDAGHGKAACGEHKHRGEHGPRGHQFFKKMAKELGLSDQQKTQAKALFEQNRTKNKPLFGALMTEKHELRKLVMSGSADEAAIRAQAAKVAAVQADLSVQRAQAAKQFLALLTPDQVTKLRAIQAKREQKMKEFKHGDEHPME